MAPRDSSTVGEQDARVTQLLVTSHQLYASGQQQDSINALREATTIAPEDDRVRKAFQAMNIGSTVSPGGRLSDQCRDYAANLENEVLGSSVKTASSSSQYDQAEAEETLSILFGMPVDNATKNKAVTNIASSTAGQKAVAAMLIKQATETFEDLWLCGDSAVAAMLSILVISRPWSGESDRHQAERDVFQLLLAKLLEPAQEAAEMAMRALARLISVDMKTSESLIDASNFDIILSMLGIQYSAAVRSQATLVTAKFLEAAPDRGQKMLTDYVVSRAGRPNVDDLVAAFSVAAAIFPVLPALASTMFMTPGFLDDLISVTDKSNSARLGRVALELLSAACIDKACREAINSKCADWLQDVIDKKTGSGDDVSNHDTAMAALILCKIQAVESKDGKPVDLDPVVDLLKSRLLDKDVGNEHIAVEGLAYASVRGSVKRDLTKDSEVLRRLDFLMQIRAEDGSLVFGALTIISNLTAFRPQETVEQQKVAQLKAYANQTKPESQDPYNDDEQVNLRCRMVMQAGMIGTINKSTRRATPTLLQIVSNIILSLTRDAKRCGALIQTGLFDTIMSLSRASPNDDAILTTVRYNASYALAQLLIPLDPSLIFKAHPFHSTTSAISPLNRLITPSDTFLDSEQQRQGPTPSTHATFTAIRALTNLASLSADSATQITSTCFIALESHLWSSVSAIQQAATECILNLTSASPLAASKFFFAGPRVAEIEADALKAEGKDGAEGFGKEAKAAAKARLTLLFALTGSKARGTRLAAMGAIAGLLAWEDGAVSFLNLPLSSGSGADGNQASAANTQGAKSTARLVAAVQEAVVEADVDMLARAVTALCALVDAGGEEARDAVQDAGGVEMLRALCGAEAVKLLGLGEMVMEALGLLKAL